MQFLLSIYWQRLILEIWYFFQWFCDPPVTNENQDDCQDNHRCQTRGLILLLLVMGFKSAKWGEVKAARIGPLAVRDNFACCCISRKRKEFCGKFFKLKDSNEHRLQNTIKTIWAPSCLQPPFCLRHPAPAQLLYATPKPSTELKCSTSAFQFSSVVGPFFTHCPHWSSTSPNIWVVVVLM